VSPLLVPLLQFSPLSVAPCDWMLHLADTPIELQLRLHNEHSSASKTRRASAVPSPRKVVDANIRWSQVSCGSYFSDNTAGTTSADAVCSFSVDGDGTGYRLVVTLPRVKAQLWELVELVARRLARAKTSEVERAKMERVTQIEVDFDEHLGTPMSMWFCWTRLAPFVVCSHSLDLSRVRVFCYAFMCLLCTYIGGVLGVWTFDGETAEAGDLVTVVMEGNRRLTLLRLLQAELLGADPSAAPVHATIVPLDRVVRGTSSCRFSPCRIVTESPVVMYRVELSGWLR
jgi:hypothetical protein